MWRRCRGSLCRSLNIKTGLIVAILSGPVSAYAQKAPQPEVDLLLVLAVDVSESINKREAWLQRFGYAEALTDPTVINAIRGGRLGRIALSYLEWAGASEQHQVFGWTVIDSMDSAKAVRAELLAAPVSGGYWTSISAALDVASRMIATAPYQSERRVIDLSSDGRNNAGEPLAPVRQRVLRQRITINGLPVMAMRRNFSWPPIPYLDRYFKDCVIGGPGAFSELVEHYDDFAKTVRRKLIREIAGQRPSEAHVIPVSGGSPKSRIRCPETINSNSGDREKL